MNNASDKADEQVIETRDDEMYFTNTVEELNLVQRAPEWKEDENNE